MIFLQLEQVNPLTTHSTKYLHNVAQLTTLCFSMFAFPCVLSKGRVRLKIQQFFLLRPWGGGGVQLTMYYFVIFYAGSGQLLICLGFDNQGLPNYQLLCGFLTGVWPTTKEFCDFFRQKRVYGHFFQQFLCIFRSFQQYFVFFLVVFQWILFFLVVFSIYI